MSSRRKRLATAAIGLSAAAAVGLFLLPGHRPARAAGTVSGGGVTLTTATIALPAEDVALPDGPGVEAVRANCTGCHSAAMILTQPPLTPVQWKAEVEKMQKAFHAPVDAAAVPAIERYLSRLSDKTTPRAP